MTWNIVISWLWPLAGVIIGGLITLWVNLYLQSKERHRDNAIRQREDIYEPLYDEVENICEQLKKFENPFTYDYSTCLKTWAQFKPSVKEYRIPDDLKRHISSFYDSAEKFNSAHNNATQVVINKSVKENLERVQSELDDHEYSGENLTLLQRRILEGYGPDFLAGKIIPERRHSYSADRILKVKSGSSLTFEIFFRTVCSDIDSEPDVYKLREERSNMIKITEDLEACIHKKIKFLQKIIESKLTRV